VPLNGGVESGVLLLSFARPLPAALTAPVAQLVSLALERARLAAELSRVRTELAERSRSEQDARERARTAQSTRDHLLSVVSHDLRNPLALIFTSAELMLRRIDDSPASARNLKSAVATLRAAEQLSRTITDMVDLARLESGDYVLASRPERLLPILDEALASADTAAESKHQKLSLARPPAPDVEVLCDRRRLLQVLVAIIGNAVKFTPDKGSVTIEASAGPAEIHIVVRDTGPGIRPEQVPRLFDRYWRPRGEVPTGTGLGLSIAKALMGALGGRIWVESEPGKGAAFQLSLPRAYTRAELNGDAPPAP
jgi:signal transduction histidine kinase